VARPAPRAPVPPMIGIGSLPGVKVAQSMLPAA
jgi:hypothetical protein